MNWDTQVQPGNAQAFVPPTIANGVVISGRTQLAAAGAGAAKGGKLVLLNSDSGDVLNSMALDSPYHGGIAVLDEYLLFGTGYENPFSNSTGSLYVVKLSSGW